ncbi:DUF4265 domain-containing protein [Microbulbifer agarilyticus]|uniref:DUF4265 domain-containing protein n=1 Tax=Microbulbifer agarilyticus TaxID=260552 RepID=UPI001C97771F|nr:DUF4265 domain-containing protein [Microbulbifer agarilyticus]MBY6190891.1 DUF4265 domain-containing protein [Microbulbifer agarilyticus]MBY6211498.1 DUF4265 domain-containing protein [Microbulbifer agarilyticus]MCA0893483.1 DUF4265 domain-containing protein [Microbulbifer agarilyticus]
MTTALQIIELFAGTNPDGEPVVERMQVKVNEDDSVQLVRSPAFIKGIASGDTIKVNREDPEKPSFELVKRSGNLAVRIFCRGDSTKLSDQLTPQLEKLGGELDLESPRLLVYSIHVSCGFEEIEKILNSACDGANSVWYYGNVYDPVDGQTPLNWWQDILKPE